MSDYSFLYDEFPEVISGEQLNDVWFDVPDVLTITEVSAITGYTPNAVDRWIVKGSLRSVIVQT